MRLLLALCAVAGGTMCGSALSSALRRRVQTLEVLCGGVRLLRLHMISMFESVRHALSTTGCPLLEKVGEGMTPGVSAAQAWARVREAERRRGGCVDALSGDDLALLDGMFDQLGESGRDRQDILLDGTLEGLKRALEAARQQAKETDRLYVSLGALTGLMVALVVI